LFQCFSSAGPVKVQSMLFKILCFLFLIEVNFDLVTPYFLDNDGEIGR